MTTAMRHLITQARETASPGVAWLDAGGRPCPIGWDDCSQPVFESACGRYTDHGEPGGPGAEFCRTSCPNKLDLPDWLEDDELRDAESEKRAIESSRPSR